MFMRKVKFIGLITARKNSKRIKNKNLILIKKKPLLQYSFSALKKSKKLKIGFITTDCDIISDLAKKNNIFTIKRPSNLALDNTTSEETLKHAISYIIKKFKFFPENVVFIQPTSPLMNFRDLDNGIKKYIKTKADSLFSSYQAKYFIWQKRFKSSNRP